MILAVNTESFLTVNYDEVILNFYFVTNVRSKKPYAWYLFSRPL